LLVPAQAIREVAMSDPEHTGRHPHRIEEEQLPGVPEEVAEVLAALRGLRDRVTIPVVRACLEDAYLAIAHLTGTGGASAEGEFRDDNPDRQAA
jgi:hypothetical protein